MTSRLKKMKMVMRKMRKLTTWLTDSATPTDSDPDLILVRVSTSWRPSVMTPLSMEKTRNSGNVLTRSRATSQAEDR